jgi:hypothetical protein
MRSYLLKTLIHAKGSRADKKNRYTDSQLFWKSCEAGGCWLTAPVQNKRIGLIVKVRDVSFELSLDYDFGFCCYRLPLRTQQSIENVSFMSPNPEAPMFEVAEIRT